MKIKSPQKRIEFERFLLTLGIRDRSPIIYPKLVREQILEGIYPHLKIYFSVKDYKNKKSYLYEYFKNNSREKTEKLFNKLKIGNIIREVIWSIDGDLRSLTTQDNKILLFEFIKEIRKRIPVGICGSIPHPNDILMCKPSGEGMIPENFTIYLNQKASLYKRLGFGNVDDDLCQYAIYDENMILHPI
jgi:hypothetical protein